MYILKQYNIFQFRKNVSEFNKFTYSMYYLNLFIYNNTYHSYQSLYDVANTNINHNFVVVVPL